jgi:hypothetical protein
VILSWLLSSCSTSSSMTDNDDSSYIVTLNFFTNLSVWFSKTFIHFPYELRSSWTDIFADFKQIEYIVGGKHLGALTGRWCAWLEFGEHSSSGGRRWWQTAASPEVWPTYFVGYSPEIKNRPKIWLRGKFTAVKYC